MITHQLYALDHWDEVWVMQAGQLVQQGRWQQLISEAGPLHELAQQHSEGDCLMRTLLPFLRLYRRHPWRLGLGVVLAIVTLLASIGLLTLSGWFLAASSRWLASPACTASTTCYPQPTCVTWQSPVPPRTILKGW